jgi:hypothetical protein
VSVFAILTLAGPLLLLATTVVDAVVVRPPRLGGSVLLVAGIAYATRWTTRLTLRWWASTKAPVRTSVSPSQARRAPR